MIIKKKNITKFKFNKIRLGNFYKYYFFFSIFFVLIFITLFFQTGYWGNYKKDFLDRFYKSSYNNYLNIPKIIPQAIYGYFLKIPSINLNLSFKDQLVIEKDREEVLKKIDGTKYKFKQVVASLDYLNKNYKIDIRLKGDRDIHYKDFDKLSFKIELKKKNTLMGLNKFSLMKPRARNYVHEWIYHKLMKDAGLITLKYQLINLKINGENKGLYVLEESFDKILVERSKRRNGPVFSLKEEWNDTVFLNNIKNELPLFQVYNKKFWLSNTNKRITSEANLKLQKFINGKINIDKVFDLDKWAWFLAISDLNYYEHGTAFKSVKFYFNPLIAKFEPIPFDGHRAVVDLNPNIIGWYNYRNSTPMFELALNCKKKRDECSNSLPYRFFFNNNGKLNKEFYNNYKNKLLQISEDSYLDNFFKKYSKDIYKFNAKVFADYFYVDNSYYYGPGLYYFNKDEIYKRAKRLKKRILNQSLNVFVNQFDDKIGFTISNNLEEGLFDIHNLELKKIICFENSSNTKIEILPNKKIRSKKFLINIGDFIDKEDVICKETILIDLITNNYFLFEIDHLNKVSDYSKINTKNDKILKNYLDYFDLKNNELTLKKNITLIDDHLIIPSGYVIKFVSGNEIILINDSFIISESVVIADGGKTNIDKPIIIRGKGNNNGGGLFIKDMSQKNLFQNVIFKDLNGKLDNLLLSQYIIYGSLNFYNTEVNLSEIKMINILSEDAINIIKSNFEIKNSYFDTISSDAIDVDYGKGSLRNLKFENILNDGVDFSESNVTINNLIFNNVGDKAISVGENSNLQINNTSITKSYIGVVSKDGSIVKVDQIKINEVKFPFASYQKKKGIQLSFIESQK